jgi:hypothetical protein
MTVPVLLERAALIEYRDDFTTPKPGGKTVEVQFNPESLKVSFANQVTPGDQRGTSTKQFVGSATTKLSLALWFDVSAPPLDGTGDVRDLTREIVHFITAPPARTGQPPPKPPALGFQWGTFLFVGTLDSLDESLEFWSDDGRPLRSAVTLALSKQSISGELHGTPRGARPRAPQAGAGGAVGTQPLTPAPAGSSVQQLADQAGRDWQAVAAANGIENPRSLQPGQLLDLGAPR